MLGTLSFYAGYREFIPALVHRVDRCSDVDAVVVDDLLGLFGMSPGNRGTGDSQALFFHVALSEMWFAPEDAPAYLDTVAEWRDLTASTGLETSLALHVGVWPSYEADSRAVELPTYDGPMLMLQGGLDSATPLDQATLVGEHFSGLQQTFVVFDQGAHGLNQNTPMADGSDCSRGLYEQFLADPAAELDTGCVDAVLPLDFDGDPLYALGLFGSRDPWGG